MMEPTDGSPPNSMYMVRCGEMFPKPAIEKEDDKLVIPFNELPGEGVKYISETTDGVLALTNYRIFVRREQQEKSVPLGLIDTVQSRDLFHLIISCKDANTVRCAFHTTEKCSDWQRRITEAVAALIKLEALFAFPFYAWSSEQSELQLLHQHRAVSSMSASRSSSPGTTANNNNNQSMGTLATIANESEWSSRLRKISCQDYDEEFLKEVERLQFNLRGSWRISKINEDFKLCPSYPRHFLVPKYITDETLQSVASFRSSRRIPVAVWRHRTSGAIIARCSQPEVGWLGWRNNKDEELLQAFVNACAFDQAEQLQQNGSQLMLIPDGGGSGASGGSGDWNKSVIELGAKGCEQEGLVVSQGPNGSALLNASDGESVSSADGSHEEVRMDKPRKMLIVDARSYASAVTNRARGGGCECIDYYPSAEIQFMNLANIHAIRKSFNALRQLCASQPDMGSWLSNLEKTQWLQHLSGLLAASVTVSRTIEVEGRPVLVHCSDGWDRTPQIVATAQLCLDPYYRTVNGFKTLVEREWLSFGHKFGDRCGHGPHSHELNERCPVFLQWLDCVHQIHNQFPCSFEFSIGYLIKLAQHSHSGLFGTFLANTMRERIQNSIFDRTYSVWPFLSGPMYKNPLYVPNRATVLWPAYNIRDLLLWNEVYLGNLHTNQTAGAAIKINADAFGTKMETTLEHMESTDGDDKLDMVIGALNLEVEDEQIQTLKLANGEPVSPMSKTRSYGDLLETNSIESTGSHRRCSDPTVVPIELIKQNGLQHLNGGVKIGVDSGESESEDSEAEKRDNSFTNEDEETANEFFEPTNATINQILGDRVTGEAINSFLANECLVSDASATPNLENVIPAGVLDNSGDSVDGSPSPPMTHSETTNLDVMLESVDLRASAEDNHLLANGDQNKGSNLWLGSVETSTDTLVPANTLEDENCNGNLTNFLTKHEENEEMRRQRIDEINERIPNGIDCSVYGENSFNMGLLNDQSIYDSTTASAVDVRRQNGNNLNAMDMSLLESAIRSQPLSAKRRQMDMHQRHRRTPSNSKSEPSPHKFQNGNMSPSATMNSRFSTPGGRSPNLTPPEGPVVFDKANNVILSCPDGLAHALSEQNIRLQQIIYEHKLQVESLQRELNATRLALLKRICYQCNNNQAASSTHEEQDVSEIRDESDGGVGEDSESDTDDDDKSVASDADESCCSDASDSETNSCEIRGGDFHIGTDGESDVDLLVEDDDDDEEDDLLNMLRSMCVHGTSASPDPTTCSKSRPATNPNMDVGENISVYSWEAVDERERESGASSSSVQSGEQLVSAAPGNVLWVPDHAQKKCAGCSLDFWIGRRKHHCRSCGKIFCSDCSEFFAPLPEERLYNPVRLCGPCYLTVTTKLQSQLEEEQQYQMQQQQQSVDHHVMENYSSIVNQNYSHPKQPSSQPSSSSSSSVSAITTSIVSRVIPEDVVQVEEPTKTQQNGNVDRLMRPTTTTMVALKEPAILRNNSSCSLEAGDQLLRKSVDGGSAQRMSVSDVGASMVSNGANGCCNLKTATAN